MPRVKDDKPRGRMTAYAFFVQTCREEHKKKHPDENVVFSEFSKKCADRWKTMNDKERERFHKMAEKDKDRFDTEMKDYTPPAGAKGKQGTKRKAKKDPNAPKRALSAFFWFCSDERPNVKAELPGASVGDIAKELGKKWGEVDEATKKRYEEMAGKDKKRYEVENGNYKKKLAAAAKGEDDDEEDEEDEEDDD